MRVFFGILFAVLVALSSSGCMMLKHSTHSGPKGHHVAETTPRADLASFPVFDLRPATAESRGSILLLHEITGYTPACARMAERLQAAGYRVYAPLLIGRAFESGFWPTNRNFLRVSLSPDWDTFLPGSNPECLPELSTLLGRMVAENPGKRIGVIGMCLTGALPLLLMERDEVVWGALCHPAVPGLAWTEARKRSLPIDAGDYAAMLGHLRRKSLVGFRFAGDNLAPYQRLDRIKDDLGDAFYRYPDIEVCTHDPEIDSDHSVFTAEYCDVEGHPTRLAFDYLLRSVNEAMVRR